ncbi:hypothetical protein OsI_03218 [Oryza sativa Indica Group]|uniref:Uncharacterized protein n=4 Tax=Oryza TaxID=4527 RepID=A2ZWE8_ORYSJ|nr:hypothetical protein OsI_03218 [Oryza sativa Indica Group]EAZ13045.1 hypothetical protein OsJ_02963 [Oryza sativa Japonica Group]
MASALAYHTYGYNNIFILDMWELSENGGDEAMLQGYDNGVGHRCGSRRHYKKIASSTPAHQHDNLEY